MTRRRSKQPATPTADGFTNFAARVGLGTDNVSSASNYTFTPVSRDRGKLEAAYRGSWIVGRVVDAVAEDMTRAGVDLIGTLPPENVEQVNQEIARLRIHESQTDTVRWARLYGGAIAVHLVDGQDPGTPLRVETVSKGQYRGLFVLDRWMVQPSLSDLVTEYGPHLGQPRFYDAVAGIPALSGERIHHSRVIRIEGDPLPYWQKVSENGWGMSVVERLFDRLVAFDSTTQGAAQLVYKAYLRTVKVKNLRGILAAGGAAEKALTRQFDMIRQMQVNEGLTLLDAEDDFQASSYTFAGLSDLLMQFAHQIAGAAKIPLVRLLGMSPGGFATGDADIRNYYDDIDQQREYKLRDGWLQVINLVYRSLFSEAPPKGYGFDFNPLWQMSDKEKAEVASSITSSIVTAEESGLVSKTTALRELRQSADITGVWSNITNEEIKDAENEPPPAPESQSPSSPVDPRIQDLLAGNQGVDSTQG